MRPQFLFLSSTYRLPFLMYSNGRYATSAFHDDDEPRPYPQLEHYFRCYKRRYMNHNLYMRSGRSPSPTYDRAIQIYSISHTFYGNLQNDPIRNLDLLNILQMSFHV